MSEKPRNKRARTKKHIDQYSEEDQWKAELRDWLLALPDRKLRGIPLDSGVYHLPDFYDYRSPIRRLLELPSEDPTADEAFATLMQNAAYISGVNESHGMISFGTQYEHEFTYSELTENSLPYLKKFLTDPPKSWKSLELIIS